MSWPVQQAQKEFKSTWTKEKGYFVKRKKWHNSPAKHDVSRCEVEKAYPAVHTPLFCWFLFVFSKG